MRDPRWNDFLEAVWLMDRARASEMVADNPEVLQMRSGLGETPLHYLAVENHIDGVKWLYEKGSNLDTKNQFGTPVVFEVAQLGYRDLLVWLLKHGVDINVTDENGDDIFTYLKDYEKNEMVDFLEMHLRAEKNGDRADR